AAGNNFTIASTSASTTTNLNSGVGPDKVNVQAVGGPTNINTGGGINTVNVGSTAPLGGGVVAGITGALQITGNGTKDVLNIDDSGDAAVVSVSPTPTSVTIGAATINYNTFSKVNINLGANGSYSVNTTTNAIVFSVPVATPAAVSVTGTNVKIGANTYSFAGFSNVTINGQIFGGGSDPLTINGTAAAETFTVTTNSVAFGGTTVFYNSFASLTVYGGGGNDNFIVSGTSAPTTLIDGTSVTPGAGNTTFSVNSNNQPLTLVGGSGTDTFNVNGNSGTLTINGQNGANTFNVFAGAGSATINGGTSTNIFNVYGSSAMLTLVGHGASNTFNINGNSATLNATGGNGTDLFVINKTTAPITLQAGNGTTTFHVTGPTQAAVTVAGGSSGSASLIFDGNPISDTITLTGNTISGVGAVLTYSAISSLTVNGNGGNDIFFVKGDSTPTTLNGSTLSDTFNVQSFSSQLTINTGSAPGTVNVGSNQPGANSVLSTIVGTVTVVGNGADKLNIDDTGDANPQTQTLSNAAFIQGPATIAYSHIATLNLTLGSGGNTLAVTGTGAGTTTNINSGTGNDSVYIQGTGGTTNLNTGGGTANTIIVGSTAPTTGGKLDNLLAPLNITGGGSDSLTVDDTGGTTARNGTLNATSLALTGLGTITYAGINTLAVNLGSGGNTITVAATNPATTTSLTSGAGNDTITLVSDSSPTTIDAGGGSNAVYVRSTGAATTVATSGGGSTAVTVGSTAPTPGGILDNIQAALTVGGGVAGSLLLDDTGSNGPKTGQLAPGMITGLGMGMSGINYSGMASLTINLGPGGNTFLIKNTDTVTTLNTGAGSDTVTVQADSSTTNINTAGGNDSVAIQTINGATNVNTGTGTDSVFVGSTAPSAGGILDNIQAALTVTGSGAGTTLTLDDTGSAGAKTGTLNDPTIFGLGMAVAGVTYHAVGILNINLGSGGNNFTIASTNAATTTNLSTGSGNDTVLVQSDAGPTNINTGDGNDSVAVRSTGGVTNVNTGTGTDSVTVGSNAPAAGGILDNIQAPLAITGSGAVTTLTLDDTASAGAKTGTLTGTAVTGLGMGASGVTYAAVGTLNVNLGSGGNTFTIASTNAATTSNLNSGSGNDTVYVQSTAGPTNVVTGGGTNTVNVGSNDAVGNAEPVASSILDNIAGALGVTGSGLDALNLDDAGSAGPKVGSLTDTAITGLGMGASGVTYHGIATLKINLGSGGNTFTIAATNGQTNTNLNSGAGSDTVYVQNTAGPTNINTGGGTNTVNVGSSDGPGIPEPVANSTVNGILGALSITGGGADTLNVDDAASATAKIGQLTATAITGLGTAGIGYSGFVAVNIHLGNGGNVFTVVNTIPGSTAITSGAGADTITVQSDSGPTSVNTGGGNDAVNILATSAPITINTGGAGADVITVGSHAPAAGGTLGSIQGALTVVGDGSDTLTADDTGNVAGRTVSLSASLLQVSGVAAIGYSGLAHLNINLGSGNNAVTVTGTSATAGTAFTSGAGNDTFTVIPVAAVPAPGTLTLAGPLSIDAGLGTNTLTVDDSSDPIARSITVTGTTISGWAGPITYANFLNLNVLLGTGGSTVNVNNSTGPLPLNTTINGGTGNNSATVNYTGDFNGNLFLLNFANGSVNVSGNFNGNLNATGALGSVTVGGNFVGNLIVSGSPGSLGAVVINGSIDSGTISANTIGTIFAPALTSNPANNVVFQATQNGVLRQIQAGAPVAGSSAYNPLSSAVKFAIAYDGTSLATAPQAAIRVTNPNAAANPLDLALTSSASNAKFDLSRLDAVGAAGLKALAIEGDLLTTLTQPERTLLGYAAGTTGGVILPSDNIIGVGVRDNAAQEAIWVNSLMGVAFATLGGNPFPNLHEDEGSEILLDQPGTDVPYAKFVTMSNGRFRVPFGMAKVGLIIDTDPDNDFDSAVATFVDQNTSNTPVTAYVTVQMGPPLQFSNVGFVGDGGSITTALPVTNVSSTGPLGDLMLTSGKGVNNVTAPSVFGNVELSGGSITGTFQTTGLRIDPMTGATASVPADIGQTLLTSGAVTGVTYFHANIASTGRLVSRGSLISLLTASGTLAGPIAAQGDIGVGVVKSGGLLTRFGGIVAAGQATTGNILALGNIYGDIKISGTVAGRIGAKGAAIPGVAGQTGILGNVTLGTFASTAAVISGGMIGDAAQGTSLTISSFSGILAAEGSIKFNSTSKTNASRTFQNLTPNTTNWNAINNIWASAATFDAGGSLIGLQLLLTEMNKLTISGGVLTGT
ncbi:MAG: hypothetical protein JWL69_707, partial [Phycisphaerales bacterium]|nr:hypothetical protein [Phycisphaerales bacterium]